MKIAFGLRMVFMAIRRRLGRFVLTAAGVALAVAAMVTLEAVMQGVSDAMIRNSVALHHGHVGASWSDGPSASRELAESVRHATGADHVLPRTHAAATLVAGASQVGVDVYGVAPELEGGQTVIADKLVAGSYLAEPGEIVLGQTAAEALGASLGDEVQLQLPGAQTASFRVGGVFQTGVNAMDRYIAFTRLESLSAGRSELAVFLPAGKDAAGAVDAIRELLPTGAAVETWRESLPELVQLISLNHVSMNVVLVLVLLILAFGVANTIFNIVNERTHEFGILRAVGMTGGGVTLLVLVESFVLVGLGGGSASASGRPFRRSGLSGGWTCRRGRVPTDTSSPPA